jgi:hypothetical protein
MAFEVPDTKALFRKLKQKFLSSRIQSKLQRPKPTGSAVNLGKKPKQKRLIMSLEEMTRKRRTQRRGLLM